jgi:hypothetical protein
MHDSLERQDAIGSVNQFSAEVPAPLPSLFFDRHPQRRKLLCIELKGFEITSHYSRSVALIVCWPVITGDNGRASRSDSRIPWIVYCRIRTICSPKSHEGRHGDMLCFNVANAQKNISLGVIGVY